MSTSACLSCISLRTLPFQLFNPYMFPHFSLKLFLPLPVNLCSVLSMPTVLFLLPRSYISFQISNFPFKPIISFSLFLHALFFSSICISNSYIPSLRCHQLSFDLQNFLQYFNLLSLLLSPFFLQNVIYYSLFHSMPTHCFAKELHLLSTSPS